ncbi:phage protein Gp36 family protein [Neisseria sp. S1]|uniref:phage protein Gp36 family protein n=1 Tax=Neisseria sp. S1 TaxID=3318354 RepID=UPI003A85EEB7
MLITREDMILRFSEREIAALTDHDYGKTVNVEVLDRAIADAQAEAGSYLAAAGYKSLDGVETPRVLVLKVCDIARYYLHEDGDIEIVEKRYKAAIDWLKSLVKEPRLLGLDTTQPADKASDAMYAVRPNTVEQWHEING